MDQKVIRKKVDRNSVSAGGTTSAALLYPHKKVFLLQGSQADPIEDQLKLHASWNVALKGWIIQPIDMPVVVKLLIASNIPCLNASGIGPVSIGS